MDGRLTGQRVYVAGVNNVIRWILTFIKKVTGKHNKKQEEKKRSYPSQNIAVRFMLTAVALFFAQSLFATMASLEYIFPKLPAPIPVNAGRAIHLNLSIYWPLFGLMGAVYFFFIQECETDLYSKRLAKLQFWLLLVTFLGILGSLLLGITSGREYLEAAFPLKAAVAIDIGLIWYNLWRTGNSKGAKKGFTTLIMLLGLFSSFIFFLPNLFSFSHIVTDEIVKFWVVHLWEELSFELVGAGITAALLKYITKIDPKYIEKLLYLDAAFLVAAGLFATGHHYYWVGFPKWWLYVGVIFSILQLGPIILLASPSIKALRSGLEPKYRIVVYYLVSSVFWHITGAGLLGFVMSVPQINRYVHGTLITSAHSHMAVFGVFGVFVLGLAFFILTYSKKVSKVTLKRYLISLWLINSGLAIMSLALALAGLVHVYLSRVAGLEFISSLSLLTPYMVGRTLGAICFDAGGFIFAWETWKIYRVCKNIST